MKLKENETWNSFQRAFKSEIQIKSTFGPNREFALVTSELGRWPVGLLQTYVEAMQPNFKYQASLDPQFNQSWGLENTGQPVGELSEGIIGKDLGLVSALPLLTDLSLVTVAVADSGIDLRHEEFVGALWRNEREIFDNGKDDDDNGYVDDEYGWNFLERSNRIQDDNGHGTLVSGIIGALADNGKGSRGAANNVRILTTKALDKFGTGTTQSAIEAITYAVKQGARVINISWGGTHYDPALFEVMKWAGEKGALFVIAAGNDGKDNDVDSQPVYPASFNLPNLVSVAAYDNRDRLASFSNYGKRTTHLGAPGVQIFGPALVTSGSENSSAYRLGDGTSFAAPFVTGVAALIQGLHKEFSPAQIKEVLLKSSEVIHYYEKEKLASAGRVHIANALNGFFPPRPTGPSHWYRQNETRESEHPYPNKANQTFQFLFPGASHIRVHFARLETEECCDSVRVLDRNGLEVSSYRGNRGELVSADVLGDLLELELRSDYSMPAFGFSVDYVEVAYSEQTPMPFTQGLSSVPTLFFDSIFFQE